MEFDEKENSHKNVPQNIKSFFRKEKNEKKFLAF